MNNTFAEAIVSIRGARTLTRDVGNRTEQISGALDISKIKNIKNKTVNTRERGKTRLTTKLVPSFFTTFMANSSTELSRFCSA